MPSIPVSSSLGYVGVFSLIVGLFLILAGTGVIRLQQVTVAQGRKTWIAGIVLGVIGLIFLLPDIFQATSPKESPTTTSANTATVSPTITPPTNTSQLSTSAPSVTLQSTTSTNLTTETPSLISTAVSITDPTSNPSATSYVPLSTPIAKGFPNIQGHGSKHLILTAEDVAIGDADKYQDLLEQTDPQFTIFVIYGPINTDISLYWGGWDQWGYASPAFIDEQIQKKVDELKRNHPEDYKRRGYRIIECSGQITNCNTIQKYPLEP